MFKKHTLVGIAVVVSILMATGFAFAEEKMNEAKDKPGEITEEAQAVADLSLAGKLAEYGKRNDNPLALVVAAQIMKNTPTQKKDRSKETEGKETAKSKDKKGEVVTADILLADAKTLADKQNNDMVLALIDKESKIVAQRGRVGGPARHVDTVRAGTTDIYPGIRFQGGQQAGVVVIGDGDCDLDLYVYDENGNLIDSDTDYTDRCVAEWTPRWTGPFTIKVKNLGSVYAHYILLTN